MPYVRHSAVPKRPSYGARPHAYPIRAISASTHTIWRPGCRPTARPPMAILSPAAEGTTAFGICCRGAERPIWGRFAAAGRAPSDNRGATRLIEAGATLHGESRPVSRS